MEIKQSEEEIIMFFSRKLETDFMILKKVLIYFGDYISFTELTKTFILNSLEEYTNRACNIKEEL